MSKQIESQVMEATVPILERYGFEFIDCEYTKSGGENILTVYIDKPGGITLDDCEKVSIELDPILDQKDPIKDAYILSVSSPGLDRALKTRKDFERNIDKKIDIKLYRAIDKLKMFTAVLKAFDDESIVVELKNKKKTIARKDIAVMKQHIDF